MSGSPLSSSTYRVSPPITALIVVGLMAQLADRSWVRLPDRWTWSQRAPSPIARIEGPGVVVGNRLYVFGGFIDDELHATNRVDVYDPSADRWTPRRPMPTPVTHEGIAATGRVVWLVGGFAGDHPGRTTAIVQRYDTTADRWSLGPPLPAPRAGGTLVAVGRILHFIGGLKNRRQDATAADGNHFVLDLDDPAAGWKPAPPLPVPRCQLGGIYFNGRIYAVGGQLGHDGGPRDVDVVDAYDPSAGTWSPIASLPSPRSHFEPGIFEWNGRLVIAGGRSNVTGREAVDEIAAYDPVLGTWSNVGRLPAPLLAPIVQPIDRRIYVANGGPRPTRPLAELRVLNVPDLRRARGTVMARPRIVRTVPANGATNVSVRSGVASDDLRLPNGGIDATSLSRATVRLIRSRDGAEAPALVNTSGGFDAIALQPTTSLDPLTEYRFEVRSGVLDESGVPFEPFASRFVTGPADAPSDRSIAFEKLPLTSSIGEYITSLAFGPDGRLYGATIDGRILCFTLGSDGLDRSKQVFDSLVTTEGRPRLIVGLAFDPASTIEHPVLWISHTEFDQSFRRGNDWTGKITRLSGRSFDRVQDYVVGLPRSALDHLTNSIAFGPDGALYISQGSNTSLGAPDELWRNRPERLLSAAILRLEVGRVLAPPIDVKTEDGAHYDPYSPASPLTLYATGIRNAYDLVWHSNGHLYAPTNGSSRGTIPAAVHGSVRPDGGRWQGPDVPAVANIPTQPDFLFRVERGAYYGHPNPRRGEFVLNGGNPTDDADPAEVREYPVGTQPDPRWRPFVFDFGKHVSPNGAIEYRSGSFGGALKKKLLVTRYSQGDDILVLTLDGSRPRVVDAWVGVAGFTGLADPLDLVENPANGFLYVGEMHREDKALRKVTLLKPRPEAAMMTTTGLTCRPEELVFSARQGTRSPPRTITISNVSGRDATVARVYIGGSDFALDTPSHVRRHLAPGESLEVAVTFTPRAGHIGALTSALSVSTERPGAMAEARLYGLSAAAWEGNGEPPLQSIADTLGYAVDVGSARLQIGRDRNLVGQEVGAQLFRKAAAGPVTMTPVARYSPREMTAFGYYQPVAEGSPRYVELARLSTDTGQHQTILPALAAGKSEFDPGPKVFGVYVQHGSQRIHSQDGQNAGHAIPHGMRAYPLRTRGARRIEHAWLLGFEEAANGDYQDVVFTVSNVEPMALVKPSNTHPE